MTQREEDLKEELRRSKLTVQLRGHDWDVADVMDVVKQWMRGGESPDGTQGDPGSQGAG